MFSILKLIQTTISSLKNLIIKDNDDDNTYIYDVIINLFNLNLILQFIFTKYFILYIYY